MIYLKEDNHKIYIALFTCCTTRMLHLELQPSLDATSSLRAMKMTFGRVVYPKRLISDNYIFEKIIVNNRYNYLNTNNLITNNQSGFRPGDSTTNQLLYLVNEIHKAFDDPKSLEVRAVFLDISKAFDKVWHDGLLFKLNQNGISGGLLKLFENYLHNRKQRVVLNGSYSDYSLIESGVPQRFCPWPLIISCLH